jgi:hypothetical protein
MFFIEQQMVLCFGSCGLQVSACVVLKEIVEKVWAGSQHFSVTNAKT